MQQGFGQHWICAEGWLLPQKGQLGHKDLQTRGTPTLVKDLAGIEVVAGDFLTLGQRLKHCNQRLLNKLNCQSSPNKPSRSLLWAPALHAARAFAFTAKIGLIHSSNHMSEDTLDILRHCECDEITSAPQKALHDLEANLSSKLAMHFSALLLNGNCMSETS